SSDLAAGLFGFGLNTAFLLTAGTSSFETLIQHGGIVNLIVLLFTGGVVGWMRDSRSFIRQNLRKSSVIEQSIIQESLIDEALSELSSELLKPIDLNEISNMVLKSAMRLTHSGFGFVGFIDPETGYLVSPAIDTGIYKEFPLDPNQNIFKKFNGLWGWVLVYKKSLLTNNAKADPRASGTLEEYIPIKKFLSAPAIIEDRLVGQISLANPEKDYTEQELALVERLAPLYALAVHRYQDDDRVRASELKYRSLFESMHEGFALNEIILDEEGTPTDFIILETNAAYAEIMGARGMNLEGKTGQEILPPSELHLIDLFARVAETGMPEQVEFNLRPLQRTIQVVTFSPRKGQFATIITDITERKLTLDKLAYLSSHDSLTGLYNRQYYEEELARLERSRKYPVSVIMVDVNHLKAVNDSKGHAAGDEMLQEAATVLTAAFRGDDVIARIGGDEFAILLPSTDEAIAQAAVDRIRKKIWEYNSRKPSLLLSLAIGTTTATKSGMLKEALREADARMYLDKRKKTTTRKRSR
ncbi:MAG: diguanylate cyclase, partial [Anaerolineaceae bacterium]|nr:diguanylate cyclase [Anaerolineaceae bacterium]